MAKTGAGMSDVEMNVESRSARLLVIMVGMMRHANIEMSDCRRRLLVVEIVVTNQQQALPQDRAADVMNLHCLALPAKCFSLRQVHDHQVTRFRIPTTDD
jgi:hypothetical protein